MKSVLALIWIPSVWLFLCPIILILKTDSPLVACNIAAETSVSFGQNERRPNKIVLTLRYVARVYISHVTQQQRKSAQTTQN